jgi:hypothetical protein
MKLILEVSQDFLVFLEGAATWNKLPGVLPEGHLTSYTVHGTELPTPKLRQLKQGNILHLGKVIVLGPLFEFQHFTSNEMLCVEKGFARGLVRKGMRKCLISKGESEVRYAILQEGLDGLSLAY